MGIKNRLLGIQVNNKNRESREKRQLQEMKTMYEELEGKILRDGKGVMTTF